MLSVSWSGESLSGGAFWAALEWGPGWVTVVSDAMGRVSAVRLSGRPVPEGSKGGPAVDLLDQVSRFLDGGLAEFDAVCRLQERSVFQRAVMEALALVEYGQIVTYGELAAMAGRPGAARAVGRVMAENPCPLFLPCHRVVARSGLGGFSPGLAWKRALLFLERAGVRRTKPFE